MRVFRIVLASLAAFTLSVCFVIPAMDLAETAYDECETMLYEMMPLVWGGDS